MKKIFLPLASIITSVMIAAPAFGQVMTDASAVQSSSFGQSSIAQQKIQKIQQLVREASSHGLVYNLYFTAAVEAELQSLAAISDVAVDARLNSIVNRLASDLSRGRILPSMVGGKASLKDKAFAHKLIADSYLNGSMSSYEFISTVTPKNRIYREAQALVQKIVDLKAQGTWATKPASLTLATVKKGTKNPALVAYLRKKLDNYGYYNNTSSTLADAELDMVIRQFQTDNGVGVDGAIGTVVGWKLLDKNVDQLLTQASLNLDRTRWLPEQNAAEYIYINLARQTFQYLQNEYETLSFKTINGRLDRQTPIMVDSARQVILNPTWGVTYNIFTKDKIPLLRQDPFYAVNNHMRLYSEMTDQEVDSTTVDWSKSPSQLPYRLVQDPGPWNALGFVKFPLTNGFAIYMHDTSDRHLFGESGPRLRSSGCIRLERPFEVAEKLLNDPKWTVDSLKAFTEYAVPQATTPTDIRLKRSVPVYIAYQTMLNASGKLVAGNDPYEIDKLMYSLTISGK